MLSVDKNKKEEKASLDLSMSVKSFVNKTRKIKISDDAEGVEEKEVVAKKMFQLKWWNLKRRQQ